MAGVLSAALARVRARLRPIYPALALELGFERLSFLRAERTAQGPSLRRAHSAPLPPGALVPGGGGVWTCDPEPLRAALTELLAGELDRPRRLSLLLPDVLVRAGIVEFESLPARSVERRELVRWKLKRATPFKIEEARLDYQELAPAGAQRRLLTVVAPEATLEPLERLLSELGLEPVLVDLSTFNLWNLVVDAAPARDLLLINRDDGFFALAYVHDGELAFYRSKAVGETDGPALAQEYLLQEIHTSCLYLHERLGLPQPRHLVVRDALGDGLPRALQQRFDANVNLLEPHALIDLGGCAHLPALELQRLLPLMGALKGR
jgi:hypothetical protein